MKKKEGEYTLNSLGEAIHSLSGLVETLAINTANDFRDLHDELTKKIDSVHEELDQKIDSVHKELNQKIDSVDGKLNQKIDSVHSEVRDVRQNLAVVQEDVTEIKESLRTLEKAFDKDARTLINHENRITHLEAIR